MFYDIFFGKTSNACYLLVGNDDIDVCYFMFWSSGRSQMTIKDGDNPLTVETFQSF